MDLCCPVTQSRSESGVDVVLETGPGVQGTHVLVLVQPVFVALIPHPAGEGTEGRPVGGWGIADVSSGGSSGPDPGTPGPPKHRWGCARETLTCVSIRRVRREGTREPDPE